MSRARPAALRVSALGMSALLFDAEAGATAGPDRAVQEGIWALAEVVESWPGVNEATPGMNNLLLVFNPQDLTGEALIERVQRAWLSPISRARATRTVELPVVYGGEHGPDLTGLAERAGLDVATAVRLHTEARYTVFFLGAHPGFAYLGGLDSRLHTPRHAQPRLKVPAGTVSIGGAQAGVQAQTLPSGWQMIGRTEAAFFDAHREPSVLLAPGDEVRFRVERIDA